MKEYTGWQKKVADKLTTEYHTDERISSINNQAWAACGVIAFLYAITMLVIRVVKGQSILAEGILLILIVICLASIQKQNGIITLPKIMGKELSLTDKRKRIALYAADSAAFAASLTVFLTASDDEFQVPLVLRHFVIGFIVDFLFNYFLYEKRIKRYNAQQAALDDDENFLDDEK